MRFAAAVLVPLVLLAAPVSAGTLTAGERTCFLDPGLRPLGLVCAEASLEATLSCSAVQEGQLCTWEVFWRVRGDGAVPGTLQWKHLGPEPTEACTYLPAPAPDAGCGSQGSFVQGPVLVRTWSCRAFSHALSATASAGVPNQRNDVTTVASALLVQVVGAC